MNGNSGRRHAKEARCAKGGFANLPTPVSGHWGEGVTAKEMGDYVWLRPEMEAEIKFVEWTKGRILRHAEFVGLREGVE